MIAHGLEQVLSGLPRSYLYRFPRKSGRHVVYYIFSQSTDHIWTWLTLNVELV